MGTKTAFTAQDAIFDRLIDQDVIAISALTGGIYQLSRPKDSQREDIVIGTLAMNAEQVQEGVFNVNIHVPNLNLTGDSTQPNYPRFRSITDVIMPALENYSGYDYNFDVNSSGIPIRDGLGWFVNIRVEYWTLRN